MANGKQKGECMTLGSVSTANTDHWLTRSLQRLGQVAAATILLGIIGYPLLHLHYEGTISPWLGYLGVAVGFGAGLAVLAWRGGLRWATDTLNRFSSRGYVTFLLTLAFSLRFVVKRVLDSLPGEPRPDFFGSWVFFEQSAIYPPGERLLFQLLHFVLGRSPLSEVLYVSFLGALACWLIYRLAGMAFGQSTGRLAGLLLALLPSWVLYGDLEYDLLLGTLYMLLIYLFFVRPPQGHKLWYIALMGLLLGYTALVKPVVVLFPLAALVGYLALKVRPGEAVKRTAVMGLCMLAAISPWTIRNYLVLDHFILISTNFGVVLHTANNPEADGREMMMKPIPGEDEVQMNQRHIREAADWIVHNPLPFLKLCAYRVAWTWGSDSGFLNSNTILCGKVSPFTMNAARGVVQGAYLSVMIVWAIGLFAHRKRILGSILALAFLAPILYVWGMHVVMQAHSQHHLPTIPFVIILASATLILRAGLLPANGEPDTPLMGEH